MIGIDWGTSSFRAYRLARDGAILARIESSQGILEVPPGGFPKTLHAAIGPWLAAGEDRVLLCGMVGSRQGWLEAPYLDCPATPAGIAAATVPVAFDHAVCRLVPGLRATDADGVPDVMRGEETKLVALLDTLGFASAAACLPGTHTKWARLAGGAVQGFSTQMTGEVRAMLLAHSILGRLAEGEVPDDAAFRRGLLRATQSGGLLHHLFGARALGLEGALAPTAVADYVSGVLIGHEVAAMGATGGARDGPEEPVHLVGAAALVRAYGLALDARQMAHVAHDPDLVARGLHCLHELGRGLA